MQRSALLAEADQADGAGPVCEDDDGNTIECTLEQRLEVARDTAGDLTALQVSDWQLADEWPDDCHGWLRMILGYLLTAAAIAAGAPFWFDVLRRMSGMRTSTSTGG